MLEETGIIDSILPKKEPMIIAKWSVSGRAAPYPPLFVHPASLGILPPFPADGS